ncbi:MAG: ATP-binding cassette domain-containing protein [Pseudomonadota bacterium]
MPGLRLDHVVKRYGTVEAVRGVTFSIPEGAFCAIVGPSGCGKSSVLRMIAGLENVTEGAVIIDGRLANDIDPADRGIAMVFQDYALYQHMTVEQNLSFGLKVEHKSREEVRERVDGTARVLALQDLLGRWPQALSGGEKQGVAVGRSIIRERDIVLFDEPMSNLDADLRARTRLEIAKLHRERGFTALYVTSDQTEAMALADLVVVMRDGQIEQMGSPLDLYENPDTQFVAGFIGSPAMNFLPAVARGSRGGTVRVALAGLEASEITVPMQHPLLKPGTPLTLGIRPEHVTPANDTKFAIELDTEVTEQLGASCLIHARSRHGDPVAIKQKGFSPVRSGERLCFTFAPDKVRLFNEAGARLR